jgi:hypothetical protein
MRWRKERKREREERNSRYVESLKKYLCGLFSVFSRVNGSFCEKHRVLLSLNFQF